MSSKLVLSRSTSDALLNSRISLPRIGNLMCDNCGHRVYGSTIVGSYNSFNDYDNDIRHRPHSVYADDSNYVRFSFRNDDITGYSVSRKNNKNHHHRNKERSENHYETVGDSGSNYQMNTMDVRIKITDDIIKESDKFSDDSVDSDEYKINTNNEKIFKSDLVSAARNFKKKCLARISSLTVR